MLAVLLEAHCTPVRDPLAPIVEGYARLRRPVCCATVNRTDGGRETHVFRLGLPGNDNELHCGLYFDDAGDEQSALGPTDLAANWDTTNTLTRNRMEERQLYILGIPIQAGTSGHSSESCMILKSTGVAGCSRRVGYMRTFLDSLAPESMQLLRDAFSAMDLPHSMFESRNVDKGTYDIKII
jgi:hypothetical protein